MVQDRAILTTADQQQVIYKCPIFNDLERPLHPISRTVHTLFFDAEYLRNGTRYRHSLNGILIGTYTCPTQGCHFERP